MGDLFPLGETVMTSTVAQEAKENPVLLFFISQALSRHRKGDWGDLCPEDVSQNQLALEHGDRLFSSYFIPSVPGLPSCPAADKLWIITERDRSSTTILFPTDY